MSSGAIETIGPDMVAKSKRILVEQLIVTLSKLQLAHVAANTPTALRHASPDALLEVLASS